MSYENKIHKRPFRFLPFFGYIENISLILSLFRYILNIMQMLIKYYIFNIAFHLVTHLRPRHHPSIPQSLRKDEVDSLIVHFLTEIFRGKQYSSFCYELWCQ